MKKNGIIAFFCIMITMGCSTVTEYRNEIYDRVPPLEKNQYSKLTSYDELTEYLGWAASHSDAIELEYVGESVEGRKIPLLKVSHEKMPNDLVTIFMFAQQHGDEPSGKEGIQLLINDILKERDKHWLDYVNLLIMPMANPDGAELDKRRNASGRDMNRDHLIMMTPEVQTIHHVFQKYTPEVTIDVHEYDPYSKTWKEFGYLKNFDIQIGFLTNSNVENSIIDLFYNEIKPFMKSYITSVGYTFHEYTLGNLNEIKRLRNSTIDVNDGRQSFGILNSLSFIVEGKYGLNSIDNLERRAKSQYVTMRGFIAYVSEHSYKIKSLIRTARDKLIYSKKGDTVAIRIEHSKGDSSLRFPLLSMKTGEDSVFTVTEYYPKSTPTLFVEKPSAYLVPASEIKLVDWLKRSAFDYKLYQYNENDFITYYVIKSVETGVSDEPMEFHDVKVSKETYTKEIVDGDYVIVPINQLRSNKIVIALEPQSMLGIINYPEFEYLVKSESVYPVLRLE